MKYFILMICFLVSSAFATSGNTPVKTDKKIAKLYKKKCAKCHGDSGEGVKGKRKKPPINQLGKLDDKKLFDIIRKGYKGKIGKMPKLKAKHASDDDVKALVKLVKSFDKTPKKASK